MTAFSDLSFTPSQLAAIRHRQGPCLLNAGPGSGKTAVLIAHVWFLIRELGVDPRRILTVTFTNAAAEEMRRRFRQTERSSSGDLPRFGTIHSVFYHILKRSGASGLQIIRDKDRDTFWKNRIPGSVRAGDSLLQTLTTSLSRMLNTGGSWSDIRVPGIAADELARMYHDYQSFKLRNGLLDFDDILIRTVTLLRTDPETRAYWQQRYTYILVDEFQDINRLQYEGLRILAQPSDNLFAAGDEDQCIYGFRGSSPDMLQQFRRDYPACHSVVLDINHRAPDVLLVPARSLIRHNRNRTPKVMTGTGDPEHAGWFLDVFRDQTDQYRHIAEQALRYTRQGIPFSDQTVLLRSFRDRALVQLSMTRAGIPVCSPGAKDMLSQHFITADLIACLRTAQQAPVREDLLRIFARFCPHVSRQCIPETIVPDLWTVLRSCHHGDLQAEKELDQLLQHLRFLRQLSSDAALEFLFYGMNYQHCLREAARSSHLGPSIYQPVLERLRSIARKSPSQKAFLTVLKDLEDNGLQAPEDGPETSALRLLTMHGSKGLEFDVVFIPDLNKGIMPAGQNEDPDEADTEEERRLLYVACTRARRRLHLSYVERIHGKPVLPSEFLSQLQ